MKRTGGPERGEGAEPPERGEAVRLGTLDSYLYFHLRVAESASFRAFKRATGERDLRPGWFVVLSIIDANPGITPMALSRASGRDKSTITPVLRDLAREALIRRQPIAGDRRSYALYVTPEGQAKLAHLAACAAEHERELAAILGDGRETLIALLRRIETGLD